MTLLAPRPRPRHGPPSWPALALLVALACDRGTASVAPEQPRPELASVAPAPAPEPEAPATKKDAPAGPLAPLDDARQAALAAVPDDPEPEQIIHDSHYWTSNERSHFVWHEAVRGLGGTYVGVGADQNYLLAGWAESELLVLMDFDAAIADLHEVYRLCFARAETPEAFIALWASEREPELVAMIEAAHPDRRAHAPLVRAATAGRQLISARLRRVARSYRALDIPTFVSDQAQYDHIRTLWQNGRVVTLRGDLTGELAMRELARVLDEQQLPVTILYLSNAEQYFDYGDGFRRNIEALPFTDQAVVLRTLPWSRYGYVDEDERYHYNIQGAHDFAAWMRDSAVLNVGRLLRHRKPTKVTGFSRFEKTPAALESR